MFDDYSDDGNSINGVILFIVFMMIGIIVVCSVIIPFVIQTSSEVVENNNGEGMGIPLAMSTSVATDADYRIVVDDENVNISGDYVATLDKSDRLIVLSDKLVVYVLNNQLHFFNGFSDTVLTDMNVVIEHGSMNGTAYSWVYYPNSEGTYRAYDPPLDYKIGDTVAFGIYNGGCIINSGDTITTNNTGQTVTVQIDESRHGIDQVYYTWSD